MKTKYEVLTCDICEVAIYKQNYCTAIDIKISMSGGLYGHSNKEIIDLCDDCKRKIYNILNK
jgi:hypothetical protein